MSEMIHYMLPVIALMAALREGIIIWAAKLSMGIGCAAGIVAIYLYQDVGSGVKTLFSVFIGCYLLMYVVTLLRMKRQHRRGR